MSEKHLRCTVCDDRVGVARVDGVAKLVCHCTHVDSDISPVGLLAEEMTLKLDRWEWA